MWYSRVDTNQPKGASSLMDSITQDMKYRYSLMKYAEKYGVSRASRKYDKNRNKSDSVLGWLAINRASYRFHSCE